MEQAIPGVVGIVGITMIEKDWPFISRRRQLSRSQLFFDPERC
jgi:hypothetical protein